MINAWRGFINYWKSGHWRSDWKAGAQIVWSKKPWSEDDKVAVVFLLTFVAILVIVTLGYKN